MDNIDVRKYIVSNFKDSTIDEIRSSIVDSITSGDDDPLIGLGVMFELLWKNSSCIPFQHPHRSLLLRNGWSWHRSRILRFAGGPRRQAVREDFQ